MSDKEPNNDLLARYAIYLAAKEMGANIEDIRISADEIRNVEHQVSNNPELSEYISFLQQNYINLYQNLDESKVGHITIKPVNNKNTALISHRFRSSAKQYAFAIVAVLFLAIISLPLISGIVTPDTYPIIQESLNIQLPVARGESDSPLESGKDLFNKGLHLDAINTFGKAFQRIQQDHSSEIAMYTYYTGLAYLRQAQMSTMGLFPRFNSVFVDSSYKYLVLARSKISDRILLERDILWRLGIVETIRYTMNHKHEHYTNAEKYLNFLVENRGKHTAKATELLNKLKEGRRIKKEAIW